MSDDKALQAAQEQADNYGGFARSGKVTARDTGEVFTFRNPMCFSDDQLLAYQKLHHRMNQCDRWSDTEVPEQRMKSVEPGGQEVETLIGAHVRRGDYIEPYQEDGVMVEPLYEVQVAQIMLGDRYEKFRAGGGSSRELVEVLAELRREKDKRVSVDPKSDGDGGAVAAVPAADSQ